jgi:hypothetical protein
MVHDNDMNQLLPFDYVTENYSWVWSSINFLPDQYLRTWQFQNQYILDTSPFLVY